MHTHHHTHDTRTHVSSLSSLSLSVNLHVHITVAQFTPDLNTCHRDTNAVTLAQVVPQNRLPLDMAAELR